MTKTHAGDDLRLSIMAHDQHDTVATVMNCLFISTTRSSRTTQDDEKSMERMLQLTALHLALIWPLLPVSTWICPILTMAAANFCFHG
jgi:hypothetical protein